MSKNERLRQVQEMFKSIDPDVVELVFNGCQQKVDATVIQLSTIAEEIKSTSGKPELITFPDNSIVIDSTKDDRRNTTSTILINDTLSDTAKVNTVYSKPGGVMHTEEQDTIAKAPQHNKIISCISDLGQSSNQITGNNKKTKCSNLNQCKNTHNSKTPVHNIESSSMERPQSVKPTVRYPPPRTKPVYHSTFQPRFIPQQNFYRPRFPYMGLPFPFPRPQERANWRAQHLYQHRPPFRNPVRQPYLKKEQHNDNKCKHATNRTVHVGKQGHLSPPPKILYILRGLPGSGKSTLARTLVAKSGVIISTDDYFLNNGRYNFNPLELDAAHQWNQGRAGQFMRSGFTPLVIDNTNTEAWEMKPYVAIGLRFGYEVRIREPETSWKWNIKELLRRNQHGVTANSLRKMLERYEKNVTVESMMKTNRHATANVEKEDTDETVTNENKPKTNARETNKTSVENASRDVSVNDVSVASANEVREKRLAPSFQALNKKPSVDDKEKSNSKHMRDLAKEEITTAVEAEMQKGVRYVSEREQRFVAVQGNNNPNTSGGENKSEQTETSYLLNREFIDTVNESKTFDNKIGENSEGTPCSTNTEMQHLNVIAMSQNSVIKVEDEEMYENVKPNKNIMRSNDQTVIIKDETVTKIGDLKVEDTLSNYKIYLSGISSSMSAVSTSELPSNLQSNNYCKGLQLTDTEAITYVSDLETCVKTSDNNLGLKQDKNTSESTHMLSKTGKIKVENKDISDSFMEMSPFYKQAIDDITGIQSITSADLENMETNDSLNPLYSNTELFAETPCTDVNNKTNDSLNPLEFLQDCFSQINVDILQFYLTRCKGDLLRTVDCLLTYGVNGVQIPTEIQIQPVSETVDLTSPLTPTTSPSCSTRYAETNKVDERVFGSGFRSDLAEDIPEVTKSLTNTFKDFSFTSLRLTLDPALALQLLEIFGSFNGVSAKDSLSEDVLSVEIDQEFAKLLYTKWRNSVQKSKKNASGGGTLKKALSSPATPGGNIKRAKFKTPPPGFYGFDNDHNTPPGHGTLNEPVSLKEIMDEQLAIHVSNSEEEYEKLWKEENMDLSTKLKRSRLHGIFPTIDKLSLNEIFEANNYSLEKTVEQVQSSIGGDNFLFHLQSSNQVDRTDGSCTDTTSQPKSATKGSYQSLDDPTYQDFRAEADTHYKLREECIKKAALAYSKKQGQLAAIYAQQAKAHGEQITEANRRAAESISMIRNNNLRISNELDLHELHVGEAVEILERALEERRNKLRSPNRKCPSFIDVITGRGNRSREGKARIKPAVVEYLKRNKYRFEELNLGLYRVYLN